MVVELAELQVVALVGPVHQERITGSAAVTAAGAAAAAAEVEGLVVLAVLLAEAVVAEAAQIAGLVASVVLVLLERLECGHGKDAKAVSMDDDTLDS